MKWVLCLTVLFLINLYIFYLRPGTSVPSLIQARDEHRKEQAVYGVPGMPIPTPQPRPTVRAEPASIPYTRLQEVMLSEKVSLKQVIGGIRIPKTRREELIELLNVYEEEDELFKQMVVLYYDKTDQWIGLDYHPRASIAVRITRAKSPDSFFVTTEIPGEFRKRAEKIEGTVSDEGSLADALPPGEKSVLAQMLVELFMYERDLQTQYRPLDTFQVVVEKVYQGNVFLRYGAILLAKYQSKNGSPLSAVRFSVTPKETGYFNEQGKSVTRAWLRSPLLLPQQFPENVEFKAIQPEWRPQKLKEESFAYYPGPAKTPVRAMARGKLQTCPKELGCKWMIMQPNLEIRYLNLNLMAHGIRAGQTVSPGQIIGYVDLNVPGKPANVRVSIMGEKKVLNPLVGSSPRESSVPKEEMSRFQEEIKRLSYVGPEKKETPSGMSAWVSW